MEGYWYEAGVRRRRRYAGKPFPCTSCATCASVRRSAFICTTILHLCGFGSFNSNAGSLPGVLARRILLCELLMSRMVVARWHELRNGASSNLRTSFCPGEIHGKIDSWLESSPRVFLFCALRIRRSTSSSRLVLAS